MSEQTLGLSNLDSELLDEALRSANRILPKSGDRWSVASVENRPNAELFRLRLLRGDEKIGGAYYKRHRSMPRSGNLDEDQAELRLNQIKWRLENVASLTEGFNEEAGSRQIAMAPVLAVDSRSLTEITLEVVGEPIRHDVRWLPLRTVTESVEFGKRVGEAVKCLENGRCTPTRAVLPNWNIDTRVRKLEAILSEAERSRLRDMLVESEQEARSLTGLVPCHGDFGSMNILHTPSHLVLIDAMWFFRFPGYDLARFSMELEYGAIDWQLQWRRHRAELLAAMFAGYGDETLREHPAWTFRRLSELMRMVTPNENGSVQRARSARRLVTDIKRKRAQRELLAACHRQLH